MTRGSKFAHTTHTCLEKEGGGGGGEGKGSVQKECLVHF